MGCNLVDMPGGGRAFVCGGKPDHVHNYSIKILILKNEKTVRDTPANRLKYDDDICEEDMFCSICGRSIEQDFPPL